MCFLTLFEPAFFGSGGNGWEVPKIELEPHILPRLMPDKRIYDFQIPRTTLTNSMKK